MDINYSIEDYIVFADLCGELDEHSSLVIRSTLDKLLADCIKNNVSECVFDLSKVSFMDSTGIGVLLGRYKKFTKHDMIFKIKNPSINVDKILRMAGIYEIMPKIS